MLYYIIINYELFTFVVFTTFFLQPSQKIIMTFRREKNKDILKIKTRLKPVENASFKRLALSNTLDVMIFKAFEKHV